MAVERQLESSVGKTLRAVRRIFYRSPESSHEIPASEETIDLGHQRAFRPQPFTMEGLKKPVQIIDQHGELGPAE